VKMLRTNNLTTGTPGTRYQEHQKDTISIFKGKCAYIPCDHILALHTTAEFSAL